MSLLNRVAKLEQEIEPEPEQKPDPEREQYRQFLYSDAFFREMVDKFNALVSSLDTERTNQVMKDCLEFYQWDTGESPAQDADDQFWPRAITQYLFLLLKESLEGNYHGPLVIPAPVADYWTSEVSETEPYAELSMLDCRDCGCLVPKDKYFGYEPGSGPPKYTVPSHANMRCPLCNGTVGYDAYCDAHRESDRDERYARISLVARDKHRRERMLFTYNKGELRYWDLMFMVGNIIKHNEAVN